MTFFYGWACVSETEIWWSNSFILLHLSAVCGTQGTIQILITESDCGRIKRSRISQHALLLGVYLPRGRGGGVPVHGGVPAQGVVYLPGGGECTCLGGCTCPVVYLPGGGRGYLPRKGLTCPGGVPAQGVYLPRGCTCPRGYLPSSPPPCEQND